ncbi:secretory phospholipase A2 receptor [Oryzias latipes]|uniref:C-type lectin domain-containing protein n=1 Tax=Oryzias latipes TaxID=8090 RepID=A0A3B3HWD8_ORYLA|nr:secretory phospholipase A2 receptor [Oryzias latipes]
MKALLLFLLYAGLFEFRFARDRLQTFRSVIEQVTLEKAQKNCSSTNESLITLFDREHVDVVSNAPCSLYQTGFWVGLKEKENKNSTWSDGTELTFNKSTVTANNQQICEALDNGQWMGFNCSERMFFMCNTDQGYVLIQSEKDWCQALQYCKKVYKGLATINSTEYNDLANKTSKGLTVWIGLMHDQWEWPNKECSLFREWADTSQGGSCVCLKTSNSYGIRTEGCESEKCALCSKGRVRIKVIPDNSSWDEALTYCETMHSRLLWIEDESDQNAVSTWLNHSSFDMSTPRSFWIGLRQSVLFGFWIWSDRMVNWSNWKDEKIPEKSPFNHCGVIDREDFTWRNEDCDQKLPFLCEEDIVDFN